MLIIMLALAPSRAADTDAAPARPKTLKVLMVGNSQCPLIVNSRLIEKLAESDKDAPLIEIKGCIKSGATLKSHWEEGKGDFVVLQEIYNIQEANMRPYAAQFHELIKGTGAKTVLFGTASIISDYPQGFERLHHAHLSIGKELGVAVVDASHA